MDSCDTDADEDKPKFVLALILHVALPDSFLVSQ